MTRIVFGFLILISLNSFGLNYEGRISKSSEKISLVDKKTQKKYELVSSTQLITTYFDKLSDGDFISMDGSKSERTMTIAVNSLNYIGLKVLLGNWVAQDSICYSFTSFTNFSTTTKIKGRCKANGTPLRSFAYLVNPTLGSSWTMIISGEDSSLIGDLKILAPNEIAIDLYDSETGEILNHLHLSK